MVFSDTLIDMRNFLILLILTASAVHAEQKVVAPFVGNTLKGEPCIGNGQGYGPFDYTKRHQLSPEHLQLVEGAHFKPDVENLTDEKHRSSDSPYPDLAYTLTAWPNHPRALLSMIRFQLQINSKITKYKADIPAECYLQRAINFSPEDPVPYLLYGHYLHKVGALEKAKASYQKAFDLDPDNPKIAYSYAFLLVDANQYEEALKYAKIAYKHKKTPKLLKEKLKKLKVWIDE